VLHDNSVATPGIERRGGMTWAADNSIEIGEPLTKASPAWRFIERFGGGMHSVALQVDDIDSALGRAAGFGVRVADRPTSAVAFTRPGDTDGLLFEWNSSRQRDDPRWQGSLIDPHPSVLEPRQYAWVGAVVEDPQATARRLSDVFDTRSNDLDASGHDDAPASMVAVGDCSIALFPMPSEARAAKLWGVACHRPRFVSSAFTVANLGSARKALSSAGYEVSSGLADGSPVISGQGLPFPIVITERLLPGDPRLPNHPAT
jgi:hypothetical protein